jgi:hypothetical protein
LRTIQDGGGIFESLMTLRHLAISFASTVV